MTEPSSEPRPTSEKQREAIESGQQAMMQSMQLPFEQVMQFQREGMKMVLAGLETQERAQQHGLDLLKTTFNDYLSAIESFSQSVTRTAESTVESAAETQEQAAQAGTQQLATVQEAGTSQTAQSTTGTGPQSQQSGGAQTSTYQQGTERTGYEQGGQTGYQANVQTGQQPAPGVTGQQQGGQAGYQQGVETGYEQGGQIGHQQEGSQAPRGGEYDVEAGWESRRQGTPEPTEGRSGAGGRTQQTQGRERPSEELQTR